MASEYLKPMLDVGSPRVLNCNVMTRRILAKDPAAKLFFGCKPLNNIILIKDTDNSAYGAKSSIGTKLYLPFNENDIYEGGRTVFVHDLGLEKSLLESFGAGALPKEILDEDIRIMRIVDKLPSLDPFLLKDVFISQKIEMNGAYFEVPQELWDQIELYILQGFEPLAKAAFPEAVSSDEVARQLIEKIWEGRDLEALQPLIKAFRLPAGQELEIFAAWKGIIYYGFQQRNMLPMMTELTAWLKDVKIHLAAVSGTERADIKAALEGTKTKMEGDWQAANRVLIDYQTGYDKMFTLRTGSSDFVQFLQNSSKAYAILGNSLGRVGHAIYCWDAMSKRFPNRKMAWEQMRELLGLLAMVFGADKKKAI
jgi:hypothetical protein